MFCSIFILIFLHGVFGKIMNQGGVPYAISNPPGSSKDWEGTPGIYSTDFEENIKGMFAKLPSINRLNSSDRLIRN